METAGVEKMPEKIKVYENGVFKGNRYTIPTPNGNYNLRDYSTSKLSDGTKPKWTFDIPVKIFNNKETLR